MSELPEFTSLDVVEMNGDPLGRSVRTSRGVRRPFRFVARKVTAASATYGVLGIAAIFFGIPLLWMLLATTKSDTQLDVLNPLAFGSFHQFAMNWHGVIAFDGGAFPLWLRNSAEYCGAGVAIAIVIGIPAGYGLAITRFIGRRALLSITLIVMIVPSTTLVLPLFLEAHSVHLLGNAFSVILPFGFFPFGVYLSYIYFSTSISSELMDAAEVDGCSEWQKFWRVALPLARPIVALVAFFSFVADWNNFFLPFIMLPQQSQYPAQVGLYNLLAASPGLVGIDSSTSVTRTMVILATLVSILPVVVVFVFAQRALVRGLMGGSVKG